MKRKAEKPKTIGNSEKGDVEVRYQTDTRRPGLFLDEVVAFNATVHLEQMDDSCTCLIVETKKARACFMIQSKNGRAWVETSEFWHDKSINRRSEAAQRRENRKK